MTGLIRVTCGLGLVLAVTAGLACTLPEWLVGQGLNGESVWALAEQLVQEDLRRQQVDQRREQMLNCYARRREIVCEVVEGRLSLPEAAVHFRRLNEQRPYLAAEYRKRHPGATANESLCRQVISRVGMELESSTPDHVRAVTGRLEAELQCHLRRDGTVHLPGD
jgi:hypothetical protein